MLEFAQVIIIIDVAQSEEELQFGLLDELITWAEGTSDDGRNWSEELRVM